MPPVEIMLRYFLTIIYSMTPDSASDFPFLIDDWPSCLPLLHAILNSSPSATTGRSPHEVMYGMTLGDPLRQLSSVPEGVMIQDFTLGDDAYEALKLAAVYMKERYDRTHTHKHFNVGDRVYVTLHKGYDIPDTKTLGPKLSRQRTGPFKILERVGRLAYRLELPLHWRIHPVISIAHLEPAKEDPFNRPVPNHPDAVFSDEWEIERIVNKRIQRTKGGKHATEYVVRWTGYGPEYDQWYKEKDLSNAREAIKDYEGKESTRKGFTTKGRRLKALWTSMTA
jgi:chromodomain-containing protein